MNEKNIKEAGALRKNMAALMRRAALDADFRRLCLESSQNAYLEQTGVPLPERYVVRFIEPEAEEPADGVVRCVKLPRFLPGTWLDKDGET